MSNVTAGFDVSLYRTGVVILVDGKLQYADVIEVGEKQPRVDQLFHVSYMARSLLGKFRPSLIAIETAATWQRESHDRTRTIVALAEARAAILVAAAQYRQLESHFGEVRIVEIGVHEVREMLCGNRTASKEQVQANLVARGFCLPTRRVRKLVGGHYEEREIIDADIADGLAIAVAAEMKGNWESFCGRMKGGKRQ